MTDRASLAWDRRRTLAYALHEPHARMRARIRALRVEANMCHASVRAFDEKLDGLAFTSGPWRELGRQMRACSQRLDRAVIGFIVPQSTGCR